MLRLLIDIRQETPTSQGEVLASLEGDKGLMCVGFIATARRLLDQLEKETWEALDAGTEQLKAQQEEALQKMAESQEDTNAKN